VPVTARGKSSSSSSSTPTSSLPAYLQSPKARLSTVKSSFAEATNQQKPKAASLSSPQKPISELSTVSSNDAFKAQLEAELAEEEKEFLRKREARRQRWSTMRKELNHEADESDSKSSSSSTISEATKPSAVTVALDKKEAVSNEMMNVVQHRVDDVLNRVRTRLGQLSDKSEAILFATTKQRMPPNVYGTSVKSTLDDEDEESTKDAEQKQQQQKSVEIEAALQTAHVKSISADASKSSEVPLVSARTSATEIKVTQVLL
jgi:hypothetical protein